MVITDQNRPIPFKVKYFFIKCYLNAMTRRKFWDVALKKKLKDVQNLI